MKKLVCFIFISLLPVFCFSQIVPKEYVEIETDSKYGKYPENYKETVQKAISDELRDPDSAKFSNWSKLIKRESILNSQKIPAYFGCVFVNAKNSMGGFAGKSPYIFEIRENKVLYLLNAQGLSDTMHTVVNGLCSQAEPE